MTADAPASSPSGRPAANLPLQLTSFVGRERALAEVARLLDSTRLLTLTGTGGIGKTRLALAVAGAVAGAFPDGVRLVELAPLADPALLPRSVAVATGLHDVVGKSTEDALVEYLRDRTLLLVLDNCEHLIDAAAALTETLLRVCPDLRVLATSREPLGCPGETTWRVPVLDLPPVHPLQADPAEITTYAAVRLFLDRAMATRPDFALTAANAPAVAEICRRLDGIPLAIELAAARLRAFSPEQIAARLDDRFRLLSGGQRTALPRQQTLLATVEWSFALLSQPERSLLSRLAVFAGGWSLEAAEAVAAGDGIQAHAVLDLLAQLVEKSLVIAEQARGDSRYRLLETVRQYALDRLTESGDVERTRDRHLDWYLHVAEAAELRLRTHEGPATLDRLEAEHDNFRAALEWGLRSGKAESVQRLSGALARFWWLRSHHDEGTRWLDRALAVATERTPGRMKALHAAGYFLQHRRESARARELLAESLAIARDLGDDATAAWVLYVLGRVAYYEDDPDTAAALGREGLMHAERSGDDWVISWPLHLLGLAADIAGDWAAAREHYSRALAIRRRLGDQEGITILVSLIGIIDLRGGDVAGAQTLFREALQVQLDLGGAWLYSMPLAMFATLAATAGQREQAVRLAAASLALSERYGTPRVPIIARFLDQKLTEIRRTIDGATYEAAWEEGRALSPDGAVTEALALDVTAPSERPVAAMADSTVSFALTATEARVLRLLAAGRTTREIAAELVVAVSTVDRHLTHIYAKLGVRNRAEATAHALTHGLA